MRGVAGTDCVVSCNRPIFVNSHVQDLTVGRFFVSEEQVTVNRHVVLSVRVVDLRSWEERIHSKSACFVRNNRNNALSEFLVTHNVFQNAHKAHGRGDRLRSRALLRHGVCLVVRQRNLRVLGATLRREATQLTSTFQHVLDFRRVLTRVIVRRKLGVLLEFFVRDRN